MPDGKRKRWFSVGKGGVVVIRDTDRAARFVRMAICVRRGVVARAAASGVSVASVVERSLFRVGLPWVGSCDVWAVDGRAVVRPVGSGRVLVVDWFRFCRWVRRRGLVREYPGR